MSILLPPEFQSFVSTRVASGAYASEQDVLRMAFDLLEKRETLLAHIEEGTRQLRAGEFLEYGEEDRERFFADVTAASPRPDNLGN